MLLRFSFIIYFSLIASMATGADAAKTVRGTRRGLKSEKSSKDDGANVATAYDAITAYDAVSYPASTKSAKSAKSDKSGYGRKRMLQSEMGDRRLSLQYMTDRFNEEGSVRSFVDSLGYEANLQSGRGEKDNVLSKKDCEGLMSLIDTDSDEDEYPFEDYQKYIDENELVSIVGQVRTLSTH